MKKLIYLVTIIIAFFSCKQHTDAEKISSGEAKKVSGGVGMEYNLITEASALKWRGTKPGGEHYGTVIITEGEIIVEEEKIIGGKFTIDMNTIVNEDLKDTSLNERLVGHLKSKDFFYVEEYPLAYFEIVSVDAYKTNPEPVPGGIVTTHHVTGNLTLRSVTRSITFPAKIDFNKDKILAITNPFAIDRTQWNVSFMSKSVFAEFKDNFIADNMILILELEFVKEKKK